MHNIFSNLLAGNGVFHSYEVEEAMSQVDRKYYSEHNPYMDAPQGIGYGATISAPHMVTIKILLLYSMSHEFELFI